MKTATNRKLTIKEGATPGQEYELNKKETVIGREPGCDILIQEQVVSRKHARITKRDDQLYLEDLGSSNGTFLNENEVRGAMLLHDGDRIRLGTEIVLIFEDPTARHSPTRLSQATIIEVQQTLVEEEKKPQTLPEAPELVVTVSGGAPQTYRLERDRYTIGRSEDNDIVIASKIVSRHHARLEKIGNSYQISVLPEATNRIFTQGQPITGSHRLHNGDELSVESPIQGMMVSFRYRLAGEIIPEETEPPVATQVAQPPQRRPQPAAARTDQTMLDVDFDLEELTTPPQLVVAVAGAPSQTHILIRDRLSLGRAENNDIVIPSRIVSRNHAILERVPGGYQITIQPDAINTLLVQGRPVTGSYRLHHGDVLRVDSTIPGMMVTMTYESPSEAAKLKEAHAISFAEKTILTFGRDESNDIKLDFPTVSRFHAQVERVGRRHRVRDLHSSNGTFVNDRRITADTWLEPQDTIRIGPYRFLVGEEQFIQYDETSGLRVEAFDLNKWVRKNLNILENISLVFEPREFIVVVGQSGGGKSTLVDAVAGYRPATDGRVFVNGIDVYRNFDAIRNEIGFVPQRDIIHMELTVYQALDYAARLRMPKDTSKSERNERIMEVLEELDLTNRKDVQISRLSGGQQKRVSIGVELLTRPGLFFLDEPTSGLDPGTETAFMNLMRRLADQGRTIVMVTHATKNVMLADKVVFLARGGYLAWFGPPNEALEFFDQYRTERERLTQDMEFDQIYAILDDPAKGSGAEWAQRFQAHPAYQEYIARPLQSRGGSLPQVGSTQAAQKPTGRRRGRVSSLRQFFILSSRNLKILTRDRTSLILMLMAAPLVGLLDFVIAPLMGRAPFDYWTGDAANGSITLFLLTIYAMLVGGLSQMREIVKEADIYKRERLVNLQIFPYVLSKIWIAALLALYQAAAYTIIHYLAFEMPGGMEEFFFIYITLVLATMAGMVGGILASALSPNSSSAPLIMILLIVPLIVLSGALAPVPSTVSSIASTRWAFEGLIGVTGVGSDVMADPCWQLPEELRDDMTLEDKESASCRCMGIEVFNPESCNFPGLGQYYTEEIDKLPPEEPPGLREKPPEPILPPTPEPPADKNNTVALVQYFDTLQAYMNDVEIIQNEYKNQMQLYEAEADVYQAEMLAYQEDKAKWDISRNSAVQAAESTIESVGEEFGWAWVNKEDQSVYQSWLVTVWFAQVVIIFVYFIIILFLVKRKDVK